MEELKTQIIELVDSIDNPKILENLVVIISDYYNYYSSQKQMNEAI